MYKENLSLQQLLYRRLAIFDMSRDELRAYSRDIKTFRNPYGYDSSSCDRSLRHLTEEGLIKPITRKGFNFSYTRAIINI